MVPSHQCAAALLALPEEMPPLAQIGAQFHGGRAQPGTPARRAYSAPPTSGSALLRAPLLPPPLQPQGALLPSYVPALPASRPAGREAREQTLFRAGCVPGSALPLGSPGHTFKERPGWGSGLGPRGGVRISESHPGRLLLLPWSARPPYPTLLSSPCALWWSNLASPPRSQYQAAGLQTPPLLGHSVSLQGWRSPWPLGLLIWSKGVFWPSPHSNGAVFIPLAPRAIPLPALGWRPTLPRASHCYSGGGGQASWSRALQQARFRGWEHCAEGPRDHRHCPLLHSNAWAQPLKGPTPWFHCPALESSPQE